MTQVIPFAWPSLVGEAATTIAATIRWTNAGHRLSVAQRNVTLTPTTLVRRRRASGVGSIEPHTEESDRRPRLSPVGTISISRLKPIALGPARAGQKGCASASPSGLAAAIPERFRLGIEVGICFAPAATSGGGGLALLIARKAAVAARPANLAALDAIGTRRCRHRGRARHRHRQKCPTHRLCPVQSFVATRHPRQQSVNSRSLDDHHKFIGWRVNAASPVSG